nr:NADPH-dependent aldehyde reductase-like protein, chloroplastic [Tanacetum cinerariifolium]
EAAKRLKQGGGGTIICLMTSLVGALKPRYGPYTASKAAVEAMVKILAKELKGTNITANCVAPGPIATEMFFEGKTEEMVNKAFEMIPLGRLGVPEDVSSLVGFLASDGGEWVNGQVVRANGGFVRSAAFPAPRPRVFVGVLAETKMMSASETCFSTSVLKKRFLPLHDLTTSSSLNITVGCVHVKDVANTHILAFESVVHFSELVQVLHKLYPSFKLPDKWIDDTPIVKYQFTKERAKELGINCTPLEETGATNTAPNANGIDPTFLEALPADLRTEVLASLIATFPTDLRKEEDTKNAMANLINIIYDNETSRNPNACYLQQKSIVCPKNSTSVITNSKILSAVKGTSTIFKSSDEAIPVGNDGGEVELLYPT